MLSVSSRRSVKDTLVRVMNFTHCDSMLASVRVQVVRNGRKNTQLRMTDLWLEDSTLFRHLYDLSDTVSCTGCVVTLVNGDSLAQDTPAVDRDSIDWQPHRALITLPRLRMDSVKPLTIHGSITTTGQLSDNRYNGQTVPQHYLRTYVNAEVSVFGLPFNTGYYYTTESAGSANPINNYRFSFNYDKFYGELKNKLDKKLQAEKERNLQTPGMPDLPALNTEYEKLNAELNAPSFKTRMLKNDELLKRGELDTNFRHSFRYRQAQQQSLDYGQKLARLEEIGKMKAHYDKLDRISGMNINMQEHRALAPAGFRKALGRYGMLKPGEQFFLNVRKLDLGSFDPAYTRIVLNGVNLTGINVELNPGYLYGAFAWGKTTGGMSNPFAFDLSSGRSIMAGRLGIGRAGKTLLAVSVLKGDDDANSGNTVTGDSTPTAFIPKHNYVTGADLTHKNQFIEAGIEYARSVNRTGPATANTELGNTLKQDQSRYSGAWNAYANVSLQESSTKFGVAARVIDPYYYSFGVPYLRQDNFRVEGKAEQGFLHNQLSTGIQYRRDEDNVYDLKEATSVNNMLIYTLQARFKQYPFVVLSFAPSYQSYYNSALKLHISSSVKMYQATVGYVKTGKKSMLTSVGTYTKQYSQGNNEGMTVFHVDQYTLNETYMLMPANLQLAAMGSYTLPLSGGDTGRMFMGNVMATKSFLKNKIKVSAGYAYQRDRAEVRNIIRCGTGFALPFGISCELRLERHFIRRRIVPAGSSDMHLGQLTLTKRF